MDWQERDCDLNGLQLRVYARPGQGPRLLFLHGYLDHSHTFDTVARALPRDWDLVAFDLRGQGQSGHLPAAAHYEFGDYLLDADAAVRSLDPRPLHLVGHSLGGIVAASFAAAAPEAPVRSVFLIESLGPSGGPASGAVARLRGFLADSRRPPHAHVYATADEAAARLRQSNPTLPLHAALHLVRFGTRPVPGGLAFTFDPRHRRRFSLGLDEAQWLALSEAVTAPVFALLASRGLYPDSPKRAARLQALRAESETLDGGHHLHLERPERVAAAIQAWIERHP
jgi:pimeloyl-ACP methyl ester carboxylesterase